MSAWLSWVALAVLVILEQRRTRRLIQHEARKTMTALADITSEVANVKSVELSAITLLQSLKARLDAAIASQADDDGEALEQLSADLAASSTALAAAVAQNTPADPTGGSGAKSFDGSVATAQTGSPAPADLPDGHPFKVDAPDAPAPVPATIPPQA